MVKERIAYGIEKFLEEDFFLPEMIPIVWRKRANLAEVSCR